MIEQILNIDKIENSVVLFGSNDKNISKIQDEFLVDVTYRNSELKIIGDKTNVEYAVKAIETLQQLILKGDDINEQVLSYIITLTRSNDTDKIMTITNDCICISSTGKPIKPKTIGQKQYINAIDKNIITFAIGPAGTGKTYLAVAMAVKAFKQNLVSKIILTRPAVEAGEKLGFLPGDLQTKVDPYLRPLYDALFDMFGADTFAKHMERGTIEVAPLAYMRGRTLDDSFIILDEAQNTTKEQMKMFLTRLGNNSNAVITGDITQIDLPDNSKSGLVSAVKILENIDEIATIYFTDKDVVRSRIVASIIKAYNKYNEESNYKNG